MLDIIQNNPYRILGIYSNSPTKERVANHNRLKAFLKVGKKISFSLDLPMLLSPIERNAEDISAADAKLALPNEQLRYAQFWFMKVTSLDDIAINHLIAGNSDMAISIWKKKDNASSLQNQIVYALINENYSQAFACAEKLYTFHIKEFVSIILGECNTVDTSKLEYKFLDELCSFVEARNIIRHLHNNDWKQYVSSKTIKPLIDTLQTAIDTSKSSKGKGITARYNAGIKLMNETKATLKQLKMLLPASDLQYHMIADRLGLEILQCAIDYYNGSEATDAARKAMKLQAYALKIVVGKMAKDRCKENVDTLQEIIDNLPPSEVSAEDKSIKEELRKFCQQPDKICHAVTLLNNAKQYLQSIKTKLGSTNEYYLKISTLVIGNALHNVVEEVNDVQKDTTIEVQGRQIPVSMLLDRDTKIAQIKNALQAAWNAMKIMDTFDMESDFKANRYNQNRSILKKMCEDFGISTSTYVPASPRPASPRPASPRPTPPINHSSDNSSGCFRGCLFALIAWVVLGCIFGGICVSFDGDFVVGFIWSGIIVLGIFKVFFDD